MTTSLLPDLFSGLYWAAEPFFYLGTKTGKNLLKIVSEQGMDGLVEILEEYNFDDLEEEYLATPLRTSEASARQKHNQKLTQKQNSESSS